MIGHNHSKEYLRGLFIEIGINRIREACIVQRIGVLEPIENFCIQRNKKGHYLKHTPSGKLILSLSGYNVPQEGWVIIDD